MGGVGTPSRTSELVQEVLIWGLPSNYPETVGGLG